MPPNIENGYLQLMDPRVAEKMWRAFDLKGDQPSLIPSTFQPTFQIENLALEEWAWMRRVRRSTCAVNVGAVAAQHPVIQFISANPPGVSILTTRLISIMNDNAGTITVGIGITPLPTVAVFGLTTFPAVDDRQPPSGGAGGGSAAGNLGSTTVAAGGITAINELFRLRMVADQTILLTVPFVLTGRQVLTIMGRNQNTGLGVGIIYDERDGLPSET